MLKFKWILTNKYCLNQQKYTCMYSFFSFVFKKKKVCDPLWRHSVFNFGPLSDTRRTPTRSALKVMCMIVRDTLSELNGFTLQLHSTSCQSLKIQRTHCIQVRFINLIPMHFFTSHYINPSVFQLQLQGNQSQEALQRALEHIHSYC